MGAVNMRVALGKDHTAVLVTLPVILKVTYLLSTFKSEIDPGEVYYFYHKPQTRYVRGDEKIFLKFTSLHVYRFTG